MADIDRAYTVSRVERVENWVIVNLQTDNCPFHQILCITKDEEDKCYGTLNKGDIIYLRFLD